MSISNNNFDKESFKNKMTETEKVHYLGDLRIIGQVVNRLDDTEPIGYVIMIEKTQKFKMYTVNQTIVLLQKFKFVNAEFSYDKIVNTECSMTKLPKFNINMKVIGNFGITILGEIRDGSTKVGYRAMDTNARIVDISEAELLKLVNNNSGTNTLINAKIVNRNNTTSISGIKQEFTKIEKSKIAELKPVGDTPQKKYIKEMHAKKWFNKVLPGIIISAFTGKREILTNIAYTREQRGNMQRLYIDIDRETKIILKEIYENKNKYGIVLDDKDKDKLSKILKARHQSIVYSGEPLTTDTKVYLVLIAQFILNSDEKRTYIKDKILSDKKLKLNSDGRLGNDSLILEAKCSCLVSTQLGSLYKEFVTTLENRDKAEELKRLNTGRSMTARDKGRIFTTSTFNTAEEMAQLGFTISEANRGYDYTTKTGFNKTLLYLGDIIQKDYDKLKGLARCLGDIVNIAYIEKLISRYGDLSKTTGWANYNMKKDDIRATIEIIIAISYMFNSVAMKEYVEHTRQEELKLLGIDINYDDIAGIDYQLPRQITLYYTSGFNVFLNDNEYIVAGYHRDYLVYAQLINYRQLGIKHNIMHPLLQNDLASVVTMVTSSSCDTETVERLIGQLRFL